MTDKDRLLIQTMFAIQQMKLNILTKILVSHNLITAEDQSAFAFVENQDVLGIVDDIQKSRELWKMAEKVLIPLLEEKEQSS